MKRVEKNVLAAVTVLALVAASPLFADGSYLGSRAPEGFMPVTTPDSLAACDLICSGTPEGEPGCGLDDDGTALDTVNGGCNSTPNVFGSISLGETVCGTVARNMSARDTDWYEATFPTRTDITWTVTAASEANLFIVDGNNGCASPDILMYTQTAGCNDTQSLSMTLEAGTYWFVVAPDFGEPNIDCGDPDSSPYRATLTGPTQSTLEVPALGGFGFAAFAVLLLGVGFWALRLRRATPPAA